jgi:hypothetical protein
LDRFRGWPDFYQLCCFYRWAILRNKNINSHYWVLFPLKKQCY